MNETCGAMTATHGALETTNDKEYISRNDFWHVMRDTICPPCGVAQKKAK
ncbi:hypothetical protein LLG95_18880 [bacterium]|nr:hypothetical protein [bacterium]